ncbi:MAG: 4-hydroxy-tetrahydrodipicolinate synthase [Lachnospiraceae bacterium]
MNDKFKGIYTVAVTPFKENGDFDIEQSRKNLDWLIESGIHGIVVLGATGEYQSISDEEHMNYVSEIVPYIKDRVSVIVGASRERPEDVVKLVRHAKSCGANAAMVLPPFYCHPAQNEIVKFYNYIMDETEFPVVVYNNPGSAGVELEQETYREIMKHECALIVKESSGDIHKLTQVINDAPERTSVFCGCDNLAFESFAAGACGWICMLANIAPRDCVELYKAVCEEGDLQKGREVYQRILAALDVLESFPKPVQALKHLVSYKGLNGGYVRKPRYELSDDEKKYIEEAMVPDTIK